MFRFYKFGVGKHGVVTTKYPVEAFVPPDGFLGMPDIDIAKCDVCGECAKVCPTGAITVSERSITFDMGQCIFCAMCARSCPKEGLFMSKGFELAGRSRKDLEVEHFVKD